MGPQRRQPDRRHRPCPGRRPTPSGTRPDRNWRGNAFDFGLHFSPNGVIEYRERVRRRAPRQTARGTRYSAGDDVIVLTPGGADHDIVGAQTNIVGFTGFTNPLDLTENPAKGHIYVTEFGAQKVTLLRPIGGQAGGPEVDAQPSELIFSGVKGTTSAVQSIVVRNLGDAALQLSSATLNGVHASSFTASNWPSLPLTLAPNETATFGVTFTPSSTTVGSLARRSSWRQTMPTSPIRRVGLYGLSTNGLEGTNEPPLKQVVDTLGHPINVGGTGLILGTGPTPIGDEVLVPLFQKARPAPLESRR